jgi:hypothetical protein
MPMLQGYRNFALAIVWESMAILGWITLSKVAHDGERGVKKLV